MVRSERKEREFNMRRAEILRTAEKIFAAKSFQDVTMAEIANASGFSTGSLYQFFEGKENLYTTMIS
jgi:AcrR family transcriptional regulator